MAVDSFARILALAALNAAESGGGGGGENQNNIENVYIEDGHLHIVFTGGIDSDLGQVVGDPGKCYTPHIITTPEGVTQLTWTIEDRDGVIPDPVDLGYMDSQWQDVDPTKPDVSFNEWEGIPLDLDDDVNWEDILEEERP